MTMDDIMFGKVACPCGEQVVLRYGKGTASPAYYKTWCVKCGAILEGTVELVDGPADRLGVGADAPLYLPVSSISPRGSAGGDGSGE